MTALAHFLSIASNFLAAISSGLAAIFWFQASLVEAPKALVSKTLTNFSVVDTTPLDKWAHPMSYAEKSVTA
jgi:hypothetical protein